MSKIYLTSKVKYIWLGVLSLLLVGCKEAPQESKTLTIQLPATMGTTRAYGSYLPYDTESDFSSVVLKFWDETGNNLVHPYGFTFTKGSPEMAQLVGAGYQITVHNKVMKVSAECNFFGQPESNILRYQGSNKFASLPYRSEKASLTSPSSAGGTYSVTLSPKPNVARIELDHIIVPLKSPRLKPSAYSDMKITGIYLNNFILDSSTGEKLCLTANDYNTATGEWQGHPAEMRNLDAHLNDHFGGDTSYERKNDVYYIFPNNASSQDEKESLHVIVRLSYKKNGVQYHNRFITIRKFKDEYNNTFHFEAGTCYRIKLNYLHELFKTNDDGSTDDPTDDRPEENYVTIGGTIVVDPWDPVDIDIEL